MSDNSLRSADFTYEPFQPREFEGDSGSLLLATSKSDERDQYVIKSGMYGLACNEFMYHKIATALGLSTPEVKLLRGLPGEKHAAAIRYLPNARVYDHNSGDEASQRDFYSFQTLYVILNEEDSMEFYVDEQGRLHKLDNAASFNITYANISIFSGGMKTGLEWLSQPNPQFIEYDKYGIMYDILTERYGEPQGRPVLLCSPGSPPWTNRRCTKRMRRLMKSICASKRLLPRVHTHPQVRVRAVLA